MADSPLISIILPVHNGSKYLELSIRSCLDQSYRNIELIIVDDGSTDDSVQIAEKFMSQDKRVSIIKNKENLSLPVSLNLGHKKARGKFITWTSDDNLFQKDAISRLYGDLISSKADIVCSDYLNIDEEGVLTREARLKDIEYLLFYGVIGACFLYKAEVYHRNKGYREDLFLVEDYDFWLRALKHSTFYRIKNPGYYFYRYHEDSLTGRMAKDPELKQKCLNNLKTMYRDLFKEMELYDSDFVISYLLNKLIEPSKVGVEVLNKNLFFNDLAKISSHFQGFSFYKLKRTVIHEIIEIILKNKKHQSISTLIALHRAAGEELLRLPINRYLALWKKCIFGKMSDF